MTFEPGDLAACHGTDWTGRAISLMTASCLAPRGLRFGPSHVAILCRFEQTMIWVESTTLCPHPCLVRNRPISGAQAHHPADRIHDYTHSRGHVDLYRLTALNRFSAEESGLLTSLLVDQIVRGETSYDLRGALYSGTRALHLTRLFPVADLERLFCSELVAALLMRMGRMNHANPTCFNPARLLRVLVETGQYRRVRTFTHRDRPYPDAASITMVHGGGDET